MKKTIFLFMSSLSVFSAIQAMDQQQAGSFARHLAFAQFNITCLDGAFDPAEANRTSILLFNTRFLRQVFSSPLHRAVYCTNYKDAAWLIHHNHDINSRDPQGNTPLHRAASKNSSHMVALLLDQGANMFIENDDHRTPLDLARLSNARESIHVIEDFQTMTGEPLKKKAIEALTQGQHPRLGANSPASTVTQETLQVIAKHLPSKDFAAQAHHAPRLNLDEICTQLLQQERPRGIRSTIYNFFRNRKVQLATAATILPLAGFALWRLLR